ncbi:MAG: MFS transporter, partial [Campylobacterales bacterium]|nr:MFS transporter [Campylobacterales bacterium]
LAYDLEQLLSPTFSAFLLSFMTFHQLFVLDSVTFLISGLLLFFSSLPKRKKVFENSDFIENLVFGTKAYFKTPRLKALFFIYIVVALASAMVITNTVIYVGEYLKKGEAFVAIAMATTGFGSMIVALVLPKWLEHIEVRKVLFIGSFLIIIGLLLASFTPSWEGFLFVWFILGVGLSLIQVLAGYLVRISCNENNSMSYFSANFSLSHLCWMVAYPLSGFLGITYGLETALLIFVILAILSSLIAYKIYPNPDEQELEHIHESYQHSHHILDDDHHGDGFEKNHTHEKIVHKHKFVIDYHHKEWPT